MHTSRKPWAERLAAAETEKKVSERLAAEKKAAKNTQYGIWVDTLLGNFFVSADVLPANCKNYKNGKLVSCTVKKNQYKNLITQEIFRRKHISQTKINKNINPIKIRMEALFYILKLNIPDASVLENNIYKSALCGATASLFTALENDDFFADVLNTQFRKKLRNGIYHFGCAFDRTTAATFKLLFLHIYEHCREELLCCEEFTSLADSINNQEKLLPNFQELIMNFMESHSAFYEWKESVVKQLDQQKTTLDAIIKFYNENPRAHASKDFPKETALAMRGNAMGLCVARLSGGAMSLLKERAYQVDDNNGIDYASLTDEERKSIKHKFDKYIQMGNDFRHNNIDYTYLPQKFNIRYSLADSGNQAPDEKTPEETQEKNHYPKADASTAQPKTLFKKYRPVSSATSNATSPRP